MADNRSEIVFFDLETTIPERPGQDRSILEFGAILVCPVKLIELCSYSTLVRPPNLSVLDRIRDRRNGITRDAVSVAPPFSAVADIVFNLLNGRIWAGHNILKFDCARIREAFAEIDMSLLEAKGIIDTLVLLTERFGRRAENMKMATLATHFGLGKQTHRSLDDVRLNLEVLKSCGAVLLLEQLVSEYPEVSHPPVAAFFTPDDVSISSINVSLFPFYRGSQRIRIMHNAVILKLLCTDLKVRFGISTKYVDQAGRPRLSFAVDAPPSLCKVLDACDNRARKTFMQAGSSSEWRPVVSRKNGYWNFPTVRLHIPTVGTGDVARYGTEIFHKKAPSGAEEKLEFSNFNPTELESLFTPKTSIDAFFSLDPYDYQNAGIRLVAEKLVIHSK